MKLGDQRDTNVGLVIGKFYPPHAGHHYVIEQALETCSTVYVLVLSSRNDSVPFEVRRNWLAEVHPGACVTSVPDAFPVDYESDVAWENHVDVIYGALGEAAISHVFGSELYITRLAYELNAEPVIVDLNRRQYAIRATDIRKDTAKYWKYLSPPVRADLCQRIVCIGAESCGTTTLARDLAKALDTVWVPEYGRTYSEGMRDDQWTHDDLHHIALVQQEFEHRMARHSRHGLLICDTNVLATAVWDEYLVGPTRIVPPNTPHLYILTDICPWEDDGTRTMRTRRLNMQDRFANLLDSQLVPWIKVTGSPKQRVQTALEAINQLDWPWRPPVTERNGLAPTG